MGNWRTNRLLEMPTSFPRRERIELGVFAFVALQSPYPDFPHQGKGSTFDVQIL
jgi:hypothetical protein